MNLPDDVLYEILIHVEDDALKYYCSTSKFNKICSSREFWKFKFDQYKLPIPQSELTSETWLKLYKFIVDIDKWLNSDIKLKNINYQPVIKEKIITELIKKYEAYILSTERKYKNNNLIRIDIRRGTLGEYYVNFILTNNGSQGGIFFKNNLFKMLYELELYYFNLL
jgi:hypothetical protein